MFKAWVDDLREAPFGWIHLSNYEMTIKFMSLTRGKVSVMSLDHDLEETKTGYDIILWMVENGWWPANEIRIHTANPVGKDNMTYVINRYSPFVMKRFVEFDNNGIAFWRSVRKEAF
jgi:hypothetical protein